MRIRMPKLELAGPSNSLVVGLSLGFAGCVATAPKAGALLPGVTVTSQGQAIALSWERDSLVVRALRPGTLVEVVSEYQTSEGRVAGDPVGSGRVAPGANQLQFTLTDSVKLAPTSSVCLRFRVDGRNALPLRAAGSGSTDGFQYAAWSDLVTANSKRRSLEAERAKLEAQGTSDAEALTGFDRWKAERKLETAADCERMMVAPDGKRPASALDPAQHTNASQRECTWRLFKFLDGKLANPASFPPQAEAVYQTLLTDLKAKGLPDNTVGVVTATEILRRLRFMKPIVLAQGSVIGSPFKPLLLGIELQVTSTTEELVRGAKVSFPPEAVPGVLDAWESCLTDSTSQFRLSYESWQREQDPRLQFGRTEAARNECRARFTDAQRRIERTTLQTRRLNTVGDELTKSQVRNRSLPSGQSLGEQGCASS